MKSKLKDTPTSIEVSSIKKQKSGFEGFLELVNLTKEHMLPDDKTLFDRVRLSMDVTDTAESDYQIYIRASEYLLQILDSVSGLCFKLLGKKREDFIIENDCYDIVIKYKTFYQNRKTLESLVFSTLALERIRGTLNERKKRVITSLNHVSLLTIDEDWLINEESLQTRIFIGLDARRIKNCPICRNYFLAKPMKKETCSAKCSIIHKQRKRRADESKRKADNEKRRETRQSKKEQEKAKLRSEK